MNHLPSRPTAADLLALALADLERTTSDVIAHNWRQMQHPRMRAWLTGTGKEPQDGAAGIVSTAAAEQIRRQRQRGEAVTLAEVAVAIAKMQKGMQRAQRRQQERNERRAA